MAWVRVQGFVSDSANNGTGGTSCNSVLGTAIAVGDVILLHTTAGLDTSTANQRVTDSLGNEYRLVRHEYLSAQNQSVDAWVSFIGHAGTPTVTYTPNNGSSAIFVGFQGDHFTGSDAYSRVVGSTSIQLSGDGVSSGDIINTPVVYGCFNNYLVWSYCHDDAALTALTASGGFTVANTYNVDGWITEYRIATGFGLFAVYNSVGTSTDAFVAGAIVISPAGVYPQASGNVRGSVQRTYPYPQD